MAAKKKKTKHNPHSQSGKKRTPASMLQFLTLLEEGFGQRAAARILRIPETSCTMLLRRPDVIEMRKNIREEIAGIPRQERMKQAYAEIDHGRAELCEMAVHGEGEEKKGRLRACSLLLQSHGLIDAPGPKANAQAGAAAIAGPGQSTFEVFKAGWKIRQEEDMARRAQAEFARDNQPQLSE